MKKGLILLMAALMLTSCGATPKGPETATEPEEQDGGAVSVTVEEKDERVDIMNNVETKELCPDGAAEIRADITYPEAEHLTYHSETTGLDRGVNVLLPEGYDESESYPVLYFLHGIFGDEFSMIGDRNNRIAEISTNLALDGEAKKMIIVFPDMYAKTDPAQQPSFDPDSVLPYDNFINDLVNDLMPFIESSYPVLTGRENTAVCGFSMGGRESLFIGLERPDLFGYCGAFSPAPGLVPGKDWAMEHPGQLSEDELTFEGKDYSPYLLQISCGTRDGTVGTFPKSYHEIFERNGVEHIWFEVPDADHDSTAIKSGFYNFIRYIF